MAKDPAFLFYPGDYLRDTQCLSERVQVAYDRIMCEHMRNICISQQQLNFFTKRLTEDEKDELLSVLDKVEGGYQIEWVSVSINKRKSYSESRRKNRVGKGKTYEEDMLTYDKHMENENENVNIDINVVKDIVEEHPLQQRIKKEYPQISGLKTQLTYEQAEALSREPDDVLTDVLNAMENKADLLKKYKSVYLTIINWMKIRKTPDNGKNFRSNSGFNPNFGGGKREIPTRYSEEKFDEPHHDPTTIIFER